MGLRFLLFTVLAALGETSPLEVAGGIASLRSETALMAHRSFPSLSTGSRHVGGERKSLSTRSRHARREEATFDLNKSWDNQVILDSSNGLNKFLVDPLAVIIVTCVKCCTSGTITAAINDDDILDPSFRIDLRGMSAFVDLDISATGAATFAIPLLPSPAKFLTSLVRGVEADLGFTIDLVFDVQAGLEIRGGFAVAFPDDVFFEAGLFDGAMGNLNFDGITTQSLPFQVNLNNETTLTVSLQLQAAVGLTISDGLPLIDLSAGASVGAFVNLVQFVAALESTPECQIQSSESANLNIGIFGGASVDVFGLEFGAVPTASTTLFEVDIGTQCLVPTGVPLVPKPAPFITTPQCAVAPPATGLPMPTSQPEAGGFLQTTLTGVPPVATPHLAPAGLPPAKETAALQIIVIAQPAPIHAAPVEPAPVHPAPMHPAAMVQPAPINPPRHKRDGHLLGMSPNMPGMPPLGYVTVITATACATPVINCPADKAKTIEITTTICPPATMTPSVCFVANATNMVPFVPLPTPVVGTLDLSAPTTAPTRAPNATASFRPVETPTTRPSGAIFATASIGNNATTTGGGGGAGPPSTTGRPTAPPSTGVVTVSGGDRVVDQRWSLCSMSLALVAIAFVLTL